MMRPYSAPNQAVFQEKLLQSRELTPPRTPNATNVCSDSIHLARAHRAVKALSETYRAHTLIMMYDLEAFQMVSRSPTPFSWHHAVIVMGNNQRHSNNFDFQLGLDKGGRIARRQTEFLPDGAYLFEDQLEVKGVLAAKVITCAAWLLELYQLTAGELFFISGAAHIRPGTKCFGVFYPPFTISQPCFKNTKSRLVGVAANAPVPAGLTTVPTVFETTFTALPSGAEQAIEIVRSGDGHQSIEMSPKPSLLSLKAKRLIDENYLIYPAIARIAARLGVTHAHLSRQFKRDFGMSPSAYLHQLRLADAPLQLAQGEAIINVSQAVGYNDLSRFYKQFRKTTRTSPGVCQTMMKPHRDKPGR